MGELHNKIYSILLRDSIFKVARTKIPIPRKKEFYD
jgi:hypothetical protein